MDIMENVLNSRFQIKDENQLALPGQCAVCGKHTGKFIDFGMSEDFWGAVYLCTTDCVPEMANRLGFLSPKQSKELIKRVEQLEESLVEVNQENLELRNVASSLSRLGVTGSESVTVVEQPKDSEPVVEPEPGPVKQTASGGRTNTKPAKSKSVAGSI